LDNETITKLADSIVSKQFHLQWQLYVISGVILFLTTAGGAYLGAYLKKRAETKALKSDQKEILRQLEVNSKATETIKHEIEHGIWKKKEVVALKIEKLEIFLDTVIKLQAVHTKMQHDFVKGENIDLENYPDFAILDTLSMRQKLYFPELSAPTFELLKAFEATHPFVFGKKGKPENKEVLEKLHTLDDEMVNKYHNLLNLSSKLIEDTLS
jgi:hypothetical protein